MGKIGIADYLLDSLGGWTICCAIMSPIIIMLPDVKAALKTGGCFAKNLPRLIVS